LNETNALLILAETSHHDVIGYLLAFCHTTFLANGPIAWIEEIMIAEHVRRGGVGRELMSQPSIGRSLAEPPYLALATRRAGGFYRALGYQDSAIFFRKVLPSPS